MSAVSKMDVQLNHGWLECWGIHLGRNTCVHSVAVYALCIVVEIGHRKYSGTNISVQSMLIGLWSESVLRRRTKLRTEMNRTEYVLGSPV